MQDRIRKASDEQRDMDKLCEEGLRILDRLLPELRTEGVNEFIYLI